MKTRMARPPLALLACILLLFVAVTLVGCSKGEDDSSAAAPSGSPGGGMPSATGGMPAAAGQGGMPAPGGPMGGQPAAVPNPAPTPASAPAAAGPAQPRPGAVAFSQAPVLSKPQLVTVKQEGTSVQFYKFRFRDWDGNSVVCELPVGEATALRTPDEWRARFGIYKLEAPPKPEQTAGPKVKQPLDFPFVSPRPVPRTPQGTEAGGSGLPQPGG